MYFIHKRNHEVVEQLQSLVLDRRDDTIENHTDDPDVMSIHEKLSMWHNQAGKDDISADHELFVGVKDDVDEGMDLIGLHTYNDIILSSTAFDWLIKPWAKNALLITMGQEKLQLQQISTGSSQADFPLD
ncbi:hypothetical protein QQZ08_006917 [Neonectria magnoliae]|uniref:Uncharacterized protein n=1 Tax=Neonectria magnoliae TaxID=2732573 RepID=A0ABR1I0U7_9HYPO